MVSYDEKLIKSEQDKISEAYRKIGERYYAENKDSESPEFAEFFTEIAASEKKIAEHKASVLRENGLRLCPECGRELVIDSLFCNFCGTKLPELEEIPVEEAPAEEEASGIEAPAEETPAAEASGEELKCKNCGAALESDCLFYTECGTRVDRPGGSDLFSNSSAPAVKRCPNCGFNTTETDMRFCIECGSKLI